MIVLPFFLGLAAVFTGLTQAVPTSKDKRSFVERNGVTYNVFEHSATGAKLEFVTNSGVCETTPGVKQHSGYLSVGNNMNMFFWFFEAREDPTTAPLVAWFNGGPGCSSMIGLFQENGPCKFELGGDGKQPVNNTFSFNNYANMLYIDQPIGVGFSYGFNNVNSTETAAPLVWRLIQAFYSSFPEYKSREFGIFTESYGGHYAPQFAKYILEQNKVKTSEKINLVALGINNGWHDSKIQTKAYIDFSVSNNYKQVIDAKLGKSYMDRYMKECVPALDKCEKSGSITDCKNADRICYNGVEWPLSMGDFDVYDIRKPRNNPEPPKTYSTYLNDPEIMRRIGANAKKFEDCTEDSYRQFTSTGDSKFIIQECGDNVV